MDDGGMDPVVRKTVTVVFTDVAGFTSRGERLDPEALRTVMTRYFDEMRSILERHVGTVEKFIEDAVMAVFGVPTAHEDDALRAVRAASDMRGAIDRLNKELERDFGVTIAARIGVNNATLSRDSAHPGDASGQTWWRIATARVLAARGRSVEAVPIAREAVDRARGTEEVLSLARALVALAEVLGVAGSRDEAAAALGEARERFDLKGARMETRQAGEALESLVAR